LGVVKHIGETPWSKRGMWLYIAAVTRTVAVMFKKAGVKDAKVLRY